MSSTRPTSVSVGLCQVSVESSKPANLATASAAIEDAVRRGSRIVVLPEMFNCPYSNDSFSPYSEILPDIETPGAPALPAPLSAFKEITEDSSPSVYFQSEMAAKHNIYLIGGSIPERTADGKLFNSSLIWGPNGQLLGKHRKIHLFDINVPGKMVFKESDTLTAGNRMTIVETEFGRMGVGICYDLRFPELAALMSSAGIDILVYPGAFNTVTGPMHWELLGRARAVDNQAFVFLCSPARNPTAKYQAWGHSMIVSPWGKVLAEAQHDPAVIVETIDLTEGSEMRQNIPVLKQKRTDLYKIENLGK